jgi:hypothetical protein
MQLSQVIKSKILCKNCHDKLIDKVYGRPKFKAGDIITITNEHSKWTPSYLSILKVVKLTIYNEGMSWHYKVQYIQDGVIKYDSRFPRYYERFYQIKK